MRRTWPLVALLVAGCTTLQPSSLSVASLAPSPDPRLVNCALASPEIAIEASLDDAGPAAGVLFDSATGASAADQPGLLVVGRGVSEGWLAAPPPGLHLLYPVCLVVGVAGQGTLTHHGQTYSGVTLPLPSGAFVLP